MRIPFAEINAGDLIQITDQTTTITGFFQSQRPSRLPSTIGKYTEITLEGQEPFLILNSATIELVADEATTQAEEYTEDLLKAQHRVIKILLADIERLLPNITGVTMASAAELIERQLQQVKAANRILNGK